MPAPAEDDPIAEGRAADLAAPFTMCIVCPFWYPSHQPLSHNIHQGKQSYLNLVLRYGIFILQHLAYANLLVRR